MRQIILWIYMIGLMIGAVSFKALALPVTDPTRDAKAVQQQVESVAAQANEVVIKKANDTAEKSERGNATCNSNPEQTKKQKKYLTTEAYEYIKKNVLDAKEDAADNVIKPDRDYATNRENIKKTFFAEASEDSGLTSLGESLNSVTKVAGLDMSQKGLKTEDIQKVMDARKEYASQVASKNLKISLDLREKIIKDIASTSNVETAGCNQVQGLLMENRNMGALVKETATDIVVQILMLESLGAKMLLKEEPGLVSVPKKPESK